MLKALFPFFSRNSAHSTGSGVALLCVALMAITGLLFFPASASAIIVDEPDISLMLRSSAATVKTGTNIVYTIVVTQLEKDELANITLRDSLPAYTQLVSMKASGGACSVEAARAVVCHLWGLNLGAPARVRIEVKPLKSGRLINRIAVTGIDVGDPSPISLTAQTATIAALEVIPTPGAGTPGAGTPGAGTPGATAANTSSLTLSLNGNSFQTGSLLQLNGKLITLLLQGTFADVWLSVTDPTGNVSFRYGGTWNPIPSPIINSWPVRNWPGGHAEGVLYTYAFDGSELPGAYSLNAFLTETGTMNIIGKKVTIPFIFAR